MDGEEEKALIPTDLFTILEPKNQEIGSSYVIQKSRTTDLEAPKL